MNDLLPILLLQGGYNTSLVILGAAILGAGAGVIGVFSMLRRRALISDAVSHATLPGICLGFIAGALFLGSGRQLPILLLGAALSAVVGVLVVQWIKDRTRLPEDAAIGTVLSSFYGLGMVLLSYIQTMETGGQAGLEGFLLGATAGMLQAEAWLIAGAALVVTALTLVFAKDFGMICFDPDFARAHGWNVPRLDLLMMALLIAITVIGLKTVGLVLIIALLIIPPVAARFWTSRLMPTVLVSASIGAVGCYLGAAASATAPNLPTGGIIVLTLASIFAVSLCVAPERGLIRAGLKRFRFRIEVAERQGLLAVAADQKVLDPLARLILKHRGLIDGVHQPTLAGHAAAQKVARDQALWNRYLHDYPNEAFRDPRWSRMPIERALPPDLVAELDSAVRLEHGA